MKIYYPLTIDLYNPYPLPVMSAQQNNIGRGALVTLTAAGAVIEPDNESVQIYIRKPDGTKVYASCSLDGGRIRVDFTNQMLAVSGKAQAELEMTGGEDRITTPIFIINVQKSNIDDEAIESSNEFSVLQQMIALAQQAAGEATGAAAAANRAAEAAGSAADNASQAASDASGAAGAATSAAQSATSAASSANTAAGSANSAATAANEAAAAANEAAGKIPNLKPIATSGLASDVAIRAIQGMAATDVQAALAEQNSKIGNTYWLSGGTQISENDNLNDYTIPGNYYCSTNVLASTLQNCPIKTAFTLKVERAAGVSYPCQTIREFVTGRIFYRMVADSNTWRDWRSVAMNYDLPVFHSLEQNQTITTSTEMAYTGLYAVVPANSYYSITAIGTYVGGQPLAISINSSYSVSSGTAYVAGSYIENCASCTLSGYTANDLSFYIWAKYSNASQNNIFIKGFYTT